MPELKLLLAFKYGVKNASERVPLLRLESAERRVHKGKYLCLVDSGSSLDDESASIRISEREQIPHQRSQQSHNFPGI